MSVPPLPHRRSAAAAFLAALPNLTDDDTAIIGVDLDQLDVQLHGLRTAFPQTVRHAIAIKTMPHPEMLKHLIAAGFGLEAASLEEVQLALRAGAAPADLIFDSPVKTRSEIAWCQANLPGALLNANSLAELQRYPAEPTFQVGVRINPEVTTGAPSVYDVSGQRSKFGVAISSDRSVLVDAAIDAGVTALHMHIGSQVPTADAHVEAVGLLLEVASQIDTARTQRQDERRITTLDIGGGVRAEVSGTELMAEYGGRLLAEHPSLFDHDVRTEFGQWVHSGAGWAATRVESVEQRGVPTAFVHLGADYFMRDVYGATGAPGYGFAVVRPDGRIETAEDTATTSAYDLVGPLCFAGDVLARDLVLPPLAEGDWLVIAGTGANTLGLWSRHCSRAVPKVVATQDGAARVWSERRLLF